MSTLAAVARLRWRLFATALASWSVFRGMPGVACASGVSRAGGTCLCTAAVVACDCQVGVARIALLGALLEVHGHILGDLERCGVGLDLDRTHLPALDATTPAYVGHESRGRGALALAPIDEEADEFAGVASPWALFLATVVSRCLAASAIAIVLVVFAVGFVRSSRGTRGETSI